MFSGIGRLSCCDNGQFERDRGPIYNDSEPPVDRTFPDCLASNFLFLLNNVTTKHA